MQTLRARQRVVLRECQRTGADVIHAAKTPKFKRVSLRKLVGAVNAIALLGAIHAKG